MKWFKAEKAELAVESCDSSGSVCDAACRSDALRERAREQALRYRGRFA